MPENNLSELLESNSVVQWIIVNKFVNENQKPIEFTKHRFLIKPYSDTHPDIVVMKSAQVGFSVLAILKSFHQALHYGLNIAYVLPTNNVVQDFVAPKVNPLITSNPALAAVVGQAGGKDSVGLKQIGDRFIYYRGAFSDRQAISISVDHLVLDEYDRMPDMGVVGTYDSRLQASDYGYRSRFSNPSVPNFGVHGLFEDSDQHHWFVTCWGCNHEWFMEFETNPDTKSHFINQKTEQYECGKCGKALTNEERIDGRWVARYPESSRRGYHMSQLMAPWVTAKRILEQYKDNSPEFFHNFVLGLPYQQADLVVDRSTILRATTPMQVEKTNIVMGIDNGVLKHWVMGTPNAIFAYGKTESWEEIETMIRMYNATVVIDANPYPNIPTQLMEKYRGQVFINYYIQDSKQLGTIRWGEGDQYGKVNSDRTQIIDKVATEINTATIRFAMGHYQMDDMILHWSNMYRTVDKNDKGVEKGIWLTGHQKPDHYAHACVYYRIAREKAIIPQGGGVNPTRQIKTSGVLVDPVTNTFKGPDIKAIAEKSIIKRRRR